MLGSDPHNLNPHNCITHGPTVFLISISHRSVRGLTDSTGLLVNMYEYDPFGNIVDLEERVTNPYTFIGQWGVRKLSQSKGLYYMRARYYNSEHGRFLTVDPFGLSGKSSNLYIYAGNNPIEGIDPRGTTPFAVAAGLILAGAIVNPIVYILQEGDKWTVGGAIASSFSGAVIGAQASVYVLGGAPKFIVGAISGAKNYFVNSLITGKPLKLSDFIQETVVGGIVGVIPWTAGIWGRSKPSK